MLAAGACSGPSRIERGLVALPFHLLELFTEHGVLVLRIGKQRIDELIVAADAPVAPPLDTLVGIIPLRHLVRVLAVLGAMMRTAMADRGQKAFCPLSLTATDATPPR